MTSVVWNEKTRCYAAELLLLAEENGINCTCVFLDGDPCFIEAAREKMPAHFRSKFKTYRRGIAEILIKRGAIRHEKSGGEWAVKAFAETAPPRYAKVVDSRFDILKFSAKETSVKIAATVPERVKEFLEHAKATGVSLRLVCLPSQLQTLIGTGAKSKAHCQGFYDRLAREGEFFADILFANPHPDVPIIAFRHQLSDVGSP